MKFIIRLYFFILTQLFLIPFFIILLNVKLRVKQNKYLKAHNERNYQTIKFLSVKIV